MQETDTKGYQPLEKNEIRLLRFSPRVSNAANNLDHPKAEPNNGDLGVDVSFVRTRLMDSYEVPPYVALSWAWGNPTDLSSLTVSGRTIQVSKTLLSIFEHLTSSDRSLLLWVDAVCIDQSNRIERSGQVSLMGTIYSRAASTRVFLLSDPDPVEIGMQWLEKAANNPDLHYDPSLSPHLSLDGMDARSEKLQDSVRAFFRAPWWTRVWTVQEYVLSREVIFQCGRRQMSRTTLLAGFEALRQHESACCWTMFQETGASNSSSMSSSERERLPIVHATLRLSRLEMVVKPSSLNLYGLLGTLALFRTRLCTDPRDRIFGMLGLHFDHTDFSDIISVDYGVDPAHLYEEVALAMIKLTKTLDILSHVDIGQQQPERQPKLPSWAADWSMTMTDAFHFTYIDRVRFLPMYQAAGNTKAVWNRTSAGIIETRCSVVGSLAVLGPGYPQETSAAKQASILRNWRRFVGSNSAELGSAEVEENCHLQRLLTGDLLDSHFEDNFERARRAYQVWSTWFGAQKAIRLTSEEKNDAREVDKLVRATTFSRCIFKAQQGYFGFGPEAARKGDIIVIIPGGKVPYILRLICRCKLNGDLYKFIGDAFVQGVSDGAIFNKAGGEEILWSSICLC